MAIKHLSTANVRRNNAIKRALEYAIRVLHDEFGREESGDYQGGYLFIAEAQSTEVEPLFIELIQVGNLKDEGYYNLGSSIEKAQLMNGLIKARFFVTRGSYNKKLLKGLKTEGAMHISFAGNLIFSFDGELERYQWQDFLSLLAGLVYWHNLFAAENGKFDSEGFVNLWKLKSTVFLNYYGDFTKEEHKVMDEIIKKLSDPYAVLDEQLRRASSKVN